MRTMFGRDHYAGESAPETAKDLIAAYGDDAVAEAMEIGKLALQAGHIAEQMFWALVTIKIIDMQSAISTNGPAHNS